MTDHRDTEPPSYDDMTDRDLLLHVLGELQAIRVEIADVRQRLREGDERMTRIEANIGMAMNAAATALDSSGQTQAAARFREELNAMRDSRGGNGQQEIKTDPGGH